MNRLLITGKLNNVLMALLYRIQYSLLVMNINYRHHKYKKGWNMFVLKSNIVLKIQMYCLLIANLLMILCY